ncbi:hypothetical protein B0H10DRAFT_2228738 [Mycena sp. CBHHK59/15]|nr:hypothetical protein B0H10DRAFT_2228738 [Mycena sp. CBHHK59/15]
MINAERKRRQQGVGDADHVGDMSRDPLGQQAPTEAAVGSRGSRQCDALTIHGAPLYASTTAKAHTVGGLHHGDLAWDVRGSDMSGDAQWRALHPDTPTHPCAMSKGKLVLTSPPFRKQLWAIGRRCIIVPDNGKIDRSIG